ncbi:hypothetical protein KKF81_05620 [Candidatus Micrarchaeota archaeon]|nr:hypothetical protein [Candidatus Micrarchaeota archaeon]MBU1166407.1 hypothetical protein [Candidatus Micrarchaeota archaeon]MBU1886910.1 hypothetical protein [Candidatus Micrarchaeota archaeon]
MSSTIELIPAILVKDRKELLKRINAVSAHVNIIQIDIMDGIFVPNKTIGIDELHDLPQANYEFHWMVKDPVNWILGTRNLKGNHMHLVHIETILSSNSFAEVKRAVENVGGRLGLAINPETPLERVLPFIDQVEEVLVMTVHPGFSGQKYIHEMEKKIKHLRNAYSLLNIEVDGGIDLSTIDHASNAGANFFAAASSIFSSGTIKDNVRQLKEAAAGGRSS